MIQIGEKLRLKRKEAGFNQAALAALIGVTSQAVSQYEKGLSTPKHTVMEKLKSLFKYDFINDKALDLTVNSVENTPLMDYDNNITKENNPLVKGENTPTHEINSNDTVFINHKEINKERLTLNDSGARGSFYTSPPKENKGGDNWKQLYFNQQEQIRLLNHQIDLLNQILQQ